MIIMKWIEIWFGTEAVEERILGEDGGLKMLIILLKLFIYMRVEL